MEQKHRDAIRKNYTFIIQNLTPEALVDCLVEKEVLSMYMKEDIEVCKTRRDQVVKLLDILVRRGPEAFKIFVNALNETEQGFVAEKLLTTVQNDNNELQLNDLEL